ncbi:thiolase domain-containing protein [Pseudoclavibacter sp. 13-3]|uniref:thiolase domain-containing protein n=1 Tax=Pseudoclavibacter sp. 13-3 TaxID=2901228 RepID=UPI001E5EEE70|nr:thiolase domain-containing protein [Pseudoclavibacter sp. 13-3]MCD7100761.1 thiolase domain-containing protein [Pseudoclavibacter sp. 13-3]
MNAPTPFIATSADPLITGWAHTRFGRLDDDLEKLIVTVGRQALASAAVEPADIEEIVIGHYNSGLVPVGFPSSLALQIHPDLLFTPATRVENACASGSAAVAAGLRAVRAGDARHVLVIGVEKMTSASSEQVGAALLGASYELAGEESTGGFAQMFADIADTYVERYGDVEDALAMIASKNHANGARNPLAHLRKELDVDFCRTVSDRNPIVAGRLKRTDCSAVSDGAAALVISRRDSAPQTEHGSVLIRGFAQANDYLPSDRRDATAFAGTRAAWQRAMASADYELRDLSLLEVHDCFTIAELILYEALGLSRPGEGHRVLDDGTVYPDGRLPVNLSGGLKAKGHPVGATGVSQHVLGAMQVTGTAGPIQHSDARSVGILNMGGTAVANYASILERA